MTRDQLPRVLKRALVQIGTCRSFPRRTVVQDSTGNEGVLLKTEPLSRRLPSGPARASLALGLIRKVIHEDLELPSKEDWSLGLRAQIDLFE